MTSFATIVVLLGALAQATTSPTTAPTTQPTPPSADALAAIDILATRSGLPREERHMHKIGGFALGCIPAPIVTSRRRHAFMAHHLLDRRQVGAGVEQLGDTRPTPVVRGEWRDPRG